MAHDHDSLRRRTFLGVVGAAGAAAAGCGGDSGTTPTGPVDVGPTADWPARTWKLICAQNLLVGRDETGFYALDAICTHMACTVLLAGSQCTAGAGGGTASGALPEVNCACHMSRFNIRDGAPVSGPASRPLPAFKVTLSNGRVLVDRGVTVAGTARTAMT